MHPFTVANMVSTFAHLYGRRVFLNMVAGGFALDLKALGDDTEHDDRYRRIVEYTTIVMRLLRGDGPVTYRGDFYQVTNLRIRNPVEPSLLPGLTVSGSSAAGAEAARALGATAIQYPQPPDAYDTEQHDAEADQGIRIGIIARDTDAEAWAVAHQRFPGDRHGQLTHRLAMAVSDSVWHRQLSELADESSAGRSPYWLHPFQNYKTFCPYLVGSYDAVAGELAGYIRRGFSTFILDIPRAADEFDHVRRALASADAVLAA
jgi:alkanesulfonate monooxygenase